MRRAPVSPAQLFRRSRLRPQVPPLVSRACTHARTRARALHRATSFAFANEGDQGGHGRALVLRRSAELSGPCRPLSSADSEQPCLRGVAHTLDLKLRFGPVVLCLVALETIAFSETLFDSLQCGSRRHSLFFCLLVLRMSLRPTHRLLACFQRSPPFALPASPRIPNALAFLA